MDSLVRMMACYPTTALETMKALEENGPRKLLGSLDVM